ncbi:hypothetical protein CBW46_018050 [Paenibacillus xerothermodurans]|uniref:Uncharacterized protein n=2 Tax=Paenibacillus xerothermodurans TaxID=1977292 RepID=A0A2W1N6M8_PAEXE|nr:hypothetical protein CBW46_018050 [Paenibacillus xerothermodurans]
MNAYPGPLFPAHSYAVYPPVPAYPPVVLPALDVQKDCGCDDKKRSVEPQPDKIQEEPTATIAVEQQKPDKPEKVKTKGSKARSNPVQQAILRLSNKRRRRSSHTGTVSPQIPWINV